MNVERSMAAYVEVYMALYRRAPNELRDLGNGWILVNGARMSMHELDLLTSQLQHELQQERARKRSLVQRLLGWFSS